MARVDCEPNLPAKFCSSRSAQIGDARSLEFGLTTATTPSGFMIDFKSFQNSTENRCCGTPPPEKQSWTTISNVEEFSDCMAARLLCTQLRASSRKTWSSPGYTRPKYFLAASYTAGSISTIVVLISCRTNASAEMPAPRPLKSQQWINAQVKVRLKMDSITHIMRASRSPPSPCRFFITSRAASCKTNVL